MSGSEIRWQKSVQSKDSTEAFLRNIFFVAPIIYAISLVVSFFAMYLYNGWDIPTTMFYATQSLLGCLYPVPEPPNENSKWITLAVYLWGYTLQATAVGVLATAIVDNVTQIERKKARLLAPEDIDGDGEVGIIDVSYYHYLRILDYIGFFDPQTFSKYVVVCIASLWVLIGMLYGHLYEEYSMSDSFFFAIGTIAQFADPAPKCEQKVVSSTGEVTYIESDDQVHCSLNPVRAYFFTVYIMIGAPLFNIVLGQISLSWIERAVRYKELCALERPLSEEEYMFACELQLHPGTNKFSFDNDDEYSDNTYTSNRNKTLLRDSMLSQSMRHRIETDMTDNQMYMQPATINNTTVDVSSARAEGFDENIPIVTNSNIPITVTENLNKNNSKDSSTKTRKSTNIPAGKTRCHKKSKDIALAEFVVLELLRLKRVTLDEIEEMKLIFDLIDFDRSGYINRYKLNRMNMVKEYVYQSDFENSDHEPINGNKFVTAKSRNDYGIVAGGDDFDETSSLNVTEKKWGKDIHISDAVLHELSRVDEEDALNNDRVKNNESSNSIVVRFSESARSSPNDRRYIRTGDDDDDDDYYHHNDEESNIGHEDSGQKDNYGEIVSDTSSNSHSSDGGDDEKSFRESIARRKRGLSNLSNDSESFRTSRRSRRPIYDGHNDHSHFHLYKLNQYSVKTPRTIVTIDETTPLVDRFDSSSNGNDNNNNYSDNENGDQTVITPKSDDVAKSFTQEYSTAISSLRSLIHKNNASFSHTPRMRAATVSPRGSRTARNRSQKLLSTSRDTNFFPLPPIESFDTNEAMSTPLLQRKRSTSDISPIISSKISSYQNLI